MHNGIGFPPKLEITNSLNRIRTIHFRNQKASQFLLTIVARMSSLSKVVKDEVQSFIELIFPSFKGFRGSRDESEATLQSEQGLGHVKKGNNP